MEEIKEEKAVGWDNTHHIIQDTSTIVASLRELKNRMRSSPSEPSFFRATPNTRENRTNPKMFIPSISVPMGTWREDTEGLSLQLMGESKETLARYCHQTES